MPAESTHLAEAALRSTLDRIQRQLRATSRISSLEALAAGNVEAVVREVATCAAETTGCARVNVWLFNDTESELRCIELFERDEHGARHSAGGVLREPDFRLEFDALKHARYVAADDPLTDPRTLGYVEPYLKPLGITSMLDAVIRSSGRNLGLLCFEHVGRAHHWDDDEIAFACQLADQIGLALAARTRLDAEHRLRVANTILTSALETSPNAVLMVDAEARILSFNRLFSDLWSLSPALVQSGDDAPVLAAVRDQVLHPDEFAARVRHLYAHPDEAGHDEVETRDGRVIDRHTAGVHTSTGEYLGRIWYFRDITERKRAEALVRHSARHDGLTGLANRHQFCEAVEAAIARARRGARGFAVVSLDLDDFKHINDTHGHPAGDELLREVANRLRASCRVTDTIARFGGDEFAVLVSDVSEPADAAALAATIVTALNQALLISVGEVRAGASLGVAIYEAGASDAGTLLSKADVALYRAKADGGGRYCFFTEAMDVQARDRVRLAEQIRTAIEGHELTLHYQPQVNGQTRRIIGIEALMRWRHPERGLLAPGAFLAVAEQTGSIGLLSTWAVREGCRQARAWLDAGVPLDRLAVNLSAWQFKAPADLERDLVAAVTDLGVPASLVELELTEMALMTASRDQHALLHRLRRHGFRLALDNFGTGCSSLDYLRRFRVDRIKIARDFTQNLASGAGSGPIVRATIGLARELGIDVIAEGVETADELRLLEDWGCLNMQGYCFSAPMSAEEIAPLLRYGFMPVADSTESPAVIHA